MRLFVALEMPSSTRRALADAITPLRARHHTLRWIPPSAWHLTLAFLGPTPVARRVRAQIALQSVAWTAQPFQLLLDGRLGRFGDRVLWAGVASSGEGLTELATAVRDALASAGVPTEDRAFRAHLTVARARRDQKVPRVSTPLALPSHPVRWTVRRMALMESQQDRGGSRYRAVATWPLRGAPPA
jgi:RNA 2',3'-cyclic 3'-phosphodiesterase